MPQNNNNTNTNKSKKKTKGRAPAHQNAFAFKHNPNSKKTLKILEAPNTHVCRRCHDKIEWRKQYRKYKPRTQPSKCNICGLRRVQAAYHTICESCTLSDKAKKAVLEHLKQQQQQQEKEGQPVVAQVENLSLEEQNEGESENTQVVDQNSDENKVKEEHAISSSSSSALQEAGRACAMCVKDFALPDSDEEEGDDPLSLQKSGGKRMTLRQRKALERQREKRNSASKARNKDTPKEEEDDDDDDNNDVNSSVNDSDDDFWPEDEDDDNNHDPNKIHNDTEEDDPFLKAVGGADKLLTGEAYQKALLEKEKQQQQQQQQDSAV